MDDLRASGYYFEGFAKNDQDVARYATVARIVAHISDAFLLGLLGGRVAKRLRLSKLREALGDE